MPSISDSPQPAGQPGTAIKEHFSWQVETGGAALDQIADRTGLSKQKIKDAMLKGAVWLKRGRKPQKRLRRAKTDLLAGDQIDVYFDSRLLAQAPLEPTKVADFRDYSVWFKPAGMLSQGTQWGDHCALLRLVEKQPGNRAVYLLHRLDREASGLVMLAHTPRAAGKLGELLQSRKVSKFYLARVAGATETEGTILFPVEGKAAETRYRRLALAADGSNSLLDVELISGRKHQIRRHFSELGFPLLGDVTYGGPRNKAGLCLLARRLEFTCPLQGHKRSVELPAELLPDWSRS